MNAWYKITQHGKYKYFGRMKYKISTVIHVHCLDRDRPSSWPATSTIPSGMDAEAFPSQTGLYCLQKCNIFTITWYMLNYTVHNLYWLKQIEKKRHVCISFCDYSTTIFKLMGSMLDFFFLWLCNASITLIPVEQHTANKLEISITNNAMKLI